MPVPPAYLFLFSVAIGASWIWLQVYEELLLIVTGIAGISSFILSLVLAPWPVKLFTLFLLISLDRLFSNLFGRTGGKSELINRIGKEQDLKNFKGRSFSYK